MKFVKIGLVVLLVVSVLTTFSWYKLKDDFAAIEDRASTPEEIEQQVASFVEAMPMFRELPAAYLNVAITANRESYVEALVSVLQSQGYECKKTDGESGGLSVRKEVEYSVEAISGHLVKINQLSEPFVEKSRELNWSISGD